MNTNLKELHYLLAELAALIEQDEELEPQLYAPFFQNPEFAFQLVDLINNLEEHEVEEHSPLYSAYIFVLDICIAQLQATIEINSRVGTKTLNKLMHYLAMLINANKHPLSFWLPILNIFYSVHVELSLELKEAFFNLASNEETLLEEDAATSPLESIKEVIAEMSDLSVFHIAEQFFAQSHAMPDDFFSDLILDLYSIEEGQDIALLILMHPKSEVRAVALSTFDMIMDQITLSSISLSRLEAIKHCYDVSHHTLFDRWIKIQRKKGVVFAHETPSPKIKIQATVVDGTGAQGIFIHASKNRKNSLCGILVKLDQGIKDVWITPHLSSVEIRHCQQQWAAENLSFREVDLNYFQLIIEHFLALTRERGDIPYLYFLEVEEMLGVRFKPNLLSWSSLFDQLSVQIVPFNQEALENSLKRSKAWLKKQRFTESWFLENQSIDKIVNSNSTFVNGVKICHMEDAIAAVFQEEIEPNREKWQFHFLWIALWSKVRSRKNEKIWQDSFLLAHLIREGKPLHEIPIMQEICRQTVINSVETMRERKTHLSKE